MFEYNLALHKQTNQSVMNYLGKEGDVVTQNRTTSEIFIGCSKAKNINIYVSRNRRVKEFHSPFSVFKNT
jgi:hypothetical protein